MDQQVVHIEAKDADAAAAEGGDQREVWGRETWRHGYLCQGAADDQALEGVTGQEDLQGSGQWAVGSVAALPNRAMLARRTGLPSRAVLGQNEDLQGNGRCG